MIKDGEAAPRKTFCDECGKRASQIVGDRILCADHAVLVKQAQAAQSQVVQSLKAAPLTMVDKHR